MQEMQETQVNNTSFIDLYSPGQHEPTCTSNSSDAKSASKKAPSISSLILLLKKSNHPARYAEEEKSSAFAFRCFRPHANPMTVVSEREQ